MGIVLQPLPALLGQGPGVDLGAWATTINQQSGFTLSSPANEFGHTFQFIAQPTAATEPYEKSGILMEGVQEDPSNGTTTKDLVAIDARTAIGANNPTGRVWGAYFEAGAQPGGDGAMTGVEVGLSNRGTPQPEFDTPTTKTGISIIAGESDDSKPVTSAMVVAGGVSRFYNGVIVYRESIVDDVNGRAYGIRDTSGGVESWPYLVTAEGDVKAASVTPGHFFPRFLNQPTEPTVLPGEELIWGDTSTGVTYRLFNNGGTTLKMAFQ